MSAQGYTNKRRVLASARNTKVQLLGNIGDTLQPLSSTVRLSPNFAINSYNNSSCDLPSFRRRYCRTSADLQPVVPEEMTTSSFTFTAPVMTAGNLLSYNPATYTLTTEGYPVNSGYDYSSLLGYYQTSSFIGVQPYTRDTYLAVLNDIFSSFFPRSMNGTSYTSLVATVDIDNHLLLTLTPPVRSSNLIIGLIFGSAPNGSTLLGITSGPPAGVTGSAFMIGYDSTEQSNAYQTVRAPYVFLDFIPH